MRLPTTRAAMLAPPDPNDQTWLIEGLWSAHSVGIIGGQPKCGKTFLALDLAVSVASGTPCLRHFPTPKAGRVLLFAAGEPRPDSAGDLGSRHILVTAGQLQFLLYLAQFQVPRQSPVRGNIPQAAKENCEAVRLNGRAQREVSDRVVPQSKQHEAQKSPAHHDEIAAHFTLKKGPQQQPRESRDHDHVIDRMKHRKPSDHERRNRKAEKQKTNDKHERPAASGDQACRLKEQKRRNRSEKVHHPTDLLKWFLPLKRDA